MKNYPLISCLCITKNSSILLQRAIDCFTAQTYQNKELLVVFESDNDEIKTVIEQNKYDAEQVKFIEFPINPKQNLGQLKNTAIEMANGEYFCQWDDDDWYAGDRLQLQMDALIDEAADVCFLGHWLFYDCTESVAYLSFRRNWEGSIVCKKGIVNEECRYAFLAKLEDTPFVNQISEKFVVAQVIKPATYIYTYHGNNTWNYRHFQNNFEKGQRMSDDYSKLITEILSGVYSNGQAVQLLDSEKYNSEMLNKIASSTIYQ